MAQDLINHFVTLESFQVLGSTSRKDAEGASRTSRAKRKEKATPGVSEPSSSCQEGQDEVEEVGCIAPHILVEYGRVSASEGEFLMTSNTHPLLPAWPWAGRATGGYPMHTPHTSWNMGLPSGAWSYTSPHWGGWGMPCVPSSSQTPPGNLRGAGAWPYLSVPDTGYNMVPLRVLPYGDYTMPLGDHLMPMVKEKICKEQYIDVFDFLNRENDKKIIERRMKKKRKGARRKNRQDLGQLVPWVFYIWQHFG